jgi:hypothetical protein
MRGVRRLSQTARKTGAVEIRYVIVAKSPIEGGALQYFSGDGFKTNSLRPLPHRGRRSAPLREIQPLPPH